MNTRAISAAGGWTALLAGALLAFPSAAAAVPVGQGSLSLTMASPFQCPTAGGVGFGSTITFDDKTFEIKPPGSSLAQEYNLSLLGSFTVDGHVNCGLDESGTFAAFATNTAGDMELALTGQYIDRAAGAHEGDRIALVGEMTCNTAREDELKTLCDFYALSFNALVTLGPADHQGQFSSAAGDFVLRAVIIGGARGSVSVRPTPDVPSGDLPWAEFSLPNSQLGGFVHSITLADTLQPGAPAFEFPRGITSIDHGTGAVPFFSGGDERFIKFEIMPGSYVRPRPRVEVCLPRQQPADPSGIRGARIVLSTETNARTNRLVDRTVKVAPFLAPFEACGRFTDSAFPGSLAGYSVTAALVEVDTCGGGASSFDGLLTVFAGLAGPTTAVVDGVSNCLNSNLPTGMTYLQRYCVPDADSTPGQCSVSLTLGINRGSCNRRTNGDPHSPHVALDSYRASLDQGRTSTDVTALFGPLIAALTDPVEATVGPVTLVLPAVQRVTTYKLRQELSGTAPGTGRTVIDRDVLTIHCVDPTKP